MPATEAPARAFLRVHPAGAALSLADIPGRRVGADKNEDERGSRVQAGTAHEMRMRIGEVAERAELSIKTIRHYDEVGLVTPSARSAGGFRLYTEADLQRLLVIRRMKPLGFTLEEMKQLLDSVAVLSSTNPPPDSRASAAAFITECHARAEESCRKLRTQLGYAEELTSQLADHATAP